MRRDLMAQSGRKRGIGGEGGVLLLSQARKQARSPQARHSVNVMQWMRASMLCLWAGLLALPVPCAVSAQAPTTPLEKPVWAKNATALSCQRGRAPIEAPDHRSSLRTVCLKAAGHFIAYELELITADGKRRHIGLRMGSNEVLWAPNSRAFVVNGGVSSSAGFFVDVYRIEDSGRVTVKAITDAAQRDMVKSFPPCKASHSDPEECKEIARDPEWNMSGLGWSDDSSAVHVFAEVPCSSRYGGIMCEVQGYELRVEDGRILRRLSARQTRREWGMLAAWKIHIPDPPEYESAQIKAR